nr:E3 ubiquitin-protein ligase SH3RF2 isoform X1 [Nothobranchius furzeri]XP_015798859.2 E3 ubiquitin-protein ligase SH3RF2 isoform X1 [Nothobranchius furzeri]
MVDCSISDVGDVFSQTGSPSKIEELALATLLKCPLCLKQLDSLAKVLPCQHTFCVSCLRRWQEKVHSQLLCPVCRLPVLVRSVEDLPENLLLARLLEGLQSLSGPDTFTQRGRYAWSSPIEEDELWAGHDREEPGHSEVYLKASNQRADSSGEPFFAPTNTVSRNLKLDDSWHYEDLAESGGGYVSALQAASQTPQLQPLQQAQVPPLCKALCDFNPAEMNLEDSKYCLGFQKGDILTVNRRVDEKWIEAELGGKVGVCPEQFVEPNSAAAKLLKGKSRRGRDSAEFYHQAGSGSKDKTTETSNRTAAHYGVPAKTPIINDLLLPSQRKQPTGGNRNSSRTLSNHRGQHQRYSVHPGLPRSNSYPSRVNLRVSRRAYSDRHQLQGEKKMTSETPPTPSMTVPSASADSRNSSTQQLSISVCAVLYSYNPRRPEELELRKGEMVGVYAKFKEGWLRGLSLRTGKVGILPSNYITPVLRTSARIVETKAANQPLLHNIIAGKKTTAPKNPAVVLALDRVNDDGAIYSTGQVLSVPNEAQHSMSFTGAAKPSFHGSTQGWDTVRRAFNPHRSSNRSLHVHSFNMASNSQPFAQVQASGYSPALQRKKSSSIPSSSSKVHSWLTESAAPSAVAMKERDFTTSHKTTFHYPRQPTNTPQSILVKPDVHKNTTEKPQKSVRFLTDEDSPPPRYRTSSWSAGTKFHPNCHPGPPPLEVWAPSLTMGRDGPGIILKEGKGLVLRKDLETAISDLSLNPQKSPHSQPSLAALSAQFSPIRYRVSTTHLAKTDSELTLLQGELVLVHKPRPDGRVLVTQESSGQTGLFHSSILQALDRLS